MKHLSVNGPIEMGEYAGETVKSCIMKYGRKSVLGILKYYDLDEEILKENHYHKKEKEMVMDNQECTSVSAPVEEFCETSTLVEELLKDYECSAVEKDSTDDVECWCWTDPYGYGEVEDSWEENEMRFPWEREDRCVEFEEGVRL